MQIAFLFADALCGTKALRKRSRELSAEETHEVQYTTKCCRRKAPHPEPTSKSGTESLEIALVRCQLALTPLDFPGVFNHHAHASKRSVRLEPYSEYGESPSLWIRKNNNATDKLYHRSIPIYSELCKQIQSIWLPTSKYIPPKVYSPVLGFITSLRRTRIERTRQSNTRRKHGRLHSFRLNQECPGPAVFPQTKRSR